MWAAVGTAKLETAGSREVSGNTGASGRAHLTPRTFKAAFPAAAELERAQGDERSDSPLGESRVAPFPCIGMILRSGVATSLPWRSLHPVPETRRELGRSQGTFWEELLMTVSSPHRHPHPHQLPSPGSWARSSRWPKGDAQGGPSDNQPSDGTRCTDFGNLTTNF